MYLIFGGTGFIGKNLCKRIEESGAKATVVSRAPDTAFLAQNAPSVGAITLEQFWANPENYLSDNPSVIYLAGQTTPGSNLDTPWQELSQNVEPAMRLASYVAKTGLGRLTYLSSGGAVYGRVGNSPVLEDHKTQPISPYGFGKQTIENSIRFLARTKGLEYSILRPSNPVGKWQTNKAQGLIGVLLRAAQSGQPFTLIGDGSAVRDYVAVSDLADAILRAANTDTKKNETWNVGSGQGQTTLDIYNLVCQITGCEIPLNRAPDRPSDVEYIVLDINKISRDLGWQPTVAFPAQIEALWDWVKSGK